MALLCDVRLAAPDTRLGLPETSLGMLPSAGATQSLTRVVPPGAALPIVMLADTMDAEEARRRGLVAGVVGDVDEAALRLAARAASYPVAAMRAAKRALRMAADVPLAAGLGEEKRLARYSMTSRA
jgi:enoyl-CoA hydratase/carnithine racemase